jgi:chromate transport protein ChrA
MALLLVQLGPQAAQFLGILGLFVTFTGFALPGAFIVIESVGLLDRQYT